MCHEKYKETDILPAPIFFYFLGTKAKTFELMIFASPPNNLAAFCNSDCDAYV